MAIIPFAVAALFSLALWLISGRYRSRFAEHEQVVMNWSFDGTPNPYAPPRVALAVTPVIGTLSLFLVAGLISFATPASEQALALPVVLFAGLVLVAVHGAHMHFAARHGGER